jgi:hypothetical protein
MSSPLTLASLNGNTNKYRHYQAHAAARKHSFWTRPEAELDTIRVSTVTVTANNTRQCFLLLSLYREDFGVQTNNMPTLVQQTG